MMPRLPGRVAAALVATTLIAASAAAAPTRLAIIYGGGESTGPAEIRRATASMAASVAIDVYAPGSTGLTLRDAAELRAYDLIFIDADADGIGRYAAKLAASHVSAPVVVVNPREGLAGSVSLGEHPWIAHYWANQSQLNYLGLVRYLIERVLARAPASTQPLPAPIVYPHDALYHPQSAAHFETLDGYLGWYRQERGAGAHRYDPGRLTVGIAFNTISFRQQNTAHIDALIRTIEKRGQNAVAVMGSGSMTADYFFQRGKPVIDVLILQGERLDFQNYENGLEQARRLGVPVLGGILHHSASAHEYFESPTGLAPEMTSSVVNAERDGSIEPLLIAAQSAERHGRRFAEPIDPQIEWRIERALAWARLHRRPNAGKRVVLTFWSEAGGKADAGGDPDDFLDVPTTLVRLLNRMKARGYDTGPAPMPDRDGLANRMARNASNTGSWAPGELAARVADGAALLPEGTYLEWFSTLPRKRRDEVIAAWGPPPGDLMVQRDTQGRRFIVIPKLEFGNVLIAPHPQWGYLSNEKVLLSKDELPPHHQYYAFFLWLRKEWRADAWVSLFTNLSLQPGKPEGPLWDDHIGQLLGALPHIHPERLGANGGPGNIRKAMAQTAGWYNLVSTAAGAERYLDLRGRLQRWADRTDTRLRAEAEASIRAEIARTGLGRALALDARTANFEPLRAQLIAYLDDLDRAHMPFGSKVLGNAPRDAVLIDMVAGMLGGDFRRASHRETSDSASVAHELVADVLTRNRTPGAAIRARLGAPRADLEAILKQAPHHARLLLTAPREIEAILEALEGRRLGPGPMDEPMRRPDALPPGRALYAFDPRALPTPEAQAIGQRQTDALLEAHRAEHAGRYPHQLAFVLWSSEATKTLGVTEAQILHLLGTRPVRDTSGGVTGVELIPRRDLGRPRVDVLVTTSGTYRDHFLHQMELITRAVRLAATSPEADNAVAAAVRISGRDLIAAGHSAERAHELATLRVFSEAPGAHSPSIQFLARSGDLRGDEARMADLYTRRMAHAYGGGIYGEYSRPAFEQRLARTEGALMPRSSSVNGMLDHPMSAAYLGGLNLASQALTGNSIDLYISNLRSSEEPHIESAARALQTELRSRYLNPKWIAEMIAHGYDGARNMMFMTENLDLWDSTATGVVASADWAEIKSVYVDDSLKQGLDQYFDRYNPHAHQMLMVNLLGAAQRGQWRASPEELMQIARRIVASVADHGPACEASMCRNESMTKFIGEALSALPDAAPLFAGYRAALARATGATAPATRTEARSDAAAASATALAPRAVTGHLMTASAPRGTASAQRDTAHFWLVMSGMALLLLTTGWMLPVDSPRRYSPRTTLSRLLNNPRRAR